jgi:uncharacterized membrane protein
MPGRAADSHGRSIAKAVSWRILGTLDTFVITLLVTGSVKWAGSIAGVESVSKVVLYYLHERAWGSFRWLQREETPFWPLACAFRRLARWDQPAFVTLTTSSNLPKEASK